MFALHKYLFYLALILLRPCIALCQCTTLGPHDGSIFSNNTSVGSVTWTTPSNAQSSDNQYSGAGQLLGVLSSAQTNYLLCTGFSFSVPATASICGIKVEVERSAAGLLIGSSIVDSRVMIVKNGVIGGTNHASGSAWPGSDGQASYGGNTDVWGLTWTPADINSSNFGFAMSATLNSGLAGLFLTADVDYVQVTVYYNNSTLPIGISQLKGFAEPGRNRLQWTTLSESGSDYFSLEKMNEPGNWSEIARVNAATNYVYEAYDTNAGEMNYYRVRQVSSVGNDGYSAVIALEGFAASQGGVTLYPVPAGDCLYLRAPGLIEAVSLYDAWQEQLPSSLAMDTSPHLDISQLPAGIYFVKIPTQHRAYISKFVKN